MNSYIFVDIDGVLNPRQIRDGGFRRYTPQKLWRRIIHGRRIHRLNLHKDYGRWLRELSAETGAELVWGTTWEHRANFWAGRPCGLPRMKYLRLTRQPGTTLGWRKATAANQLPDDTRFVWFDDEPDLGEYLTNPNGRHIHIDRQLGLQPCHIAEAREFLQTAGVKL